MSDQLVSLPHGGGAVGGLGGSFSPDLNTGGGGYEIPIDLPEGRNGHTPTVSLSYATGNPSGPFGLGWGVPLLRLDRDTGGGAPAYGPDDVFVSPGVGPLRPGVADVDRLVPETDGLVWEVRRSGDGFAILQRDGVQHLLGTTAASRVSDPADPARVAAWLVERSTSADGETIEYSYAADGSGKVLAEVRWAVYRLVFHHEEAEPSHDGSPGFLLTTTKRCVQIDLEVTTEPQPVVRRWRFAYAETPTSGRALLSSVTTSGIDAAGGEVALPTVHVEYTNDAGPVADLVALPDHVARELAAGAVLADLSGDGLPDVVQFAGHRITLCRNRGGLGVRPAERGRRARRAGSGSARRSPRTSPVEAGSTCSQRPRGSRTATRSKATPRSGGPSSTVAARGWCRVPPASRWGTSTATVPSTSSRCAAGCSPSTGAPPATGRRRRRLVGGADPLAGTDALGDHLSFASMTGAGPARPGLGALRPGPLVAGARGREVGRTP